MKKLLTFQERPEPGATKRIVQFDNGKMVVVAELASFSDESPTFVLVNDNTNELFIGHKWEANWYHWMFDIASDVFFYRNVMGVDPVIVINQDVTYPPFCAQLLTIMGEQIRLTNKATDWKNYHDTIMHDFNCVIRASRFSGRTHWFPTMEYAAIGATFPTEDRDVLFIQRKGHGEEPTRSRNVANRDAVLEKLRGAGRLVDMVYLEDMTVRQQIKLFRKYRLIILVTGAAGANLAFCDKRTSVLELVQPEFWGRFFIDIVSTLDLNYLGLKCRWLGETPKNQHDSSIVVEPDDVMRAIDLLEKRS